MQLSANNPRAPVTAALAMIPEGKPGIIATLKIMRRIVRAKKSDIALRNLALEITGSQTGKDWRGEIGAVQSWVKNNIKYVRDVNDVETLSYPENLLESRAGDCDDHSILVATLLESVGHPTRFVAVGFAPDEYDHVYTETRLGARWVSVETTEPVSVGWNPPGIVSRLIIHN